MSGTATAMGPARAFDPRIIGALIVAAILGFIGYWVLTAFSPELSSGQNGRAHALSRSAVSYSALVEVMRRTNHEVAVGRFIPEFPAREVEPGLLILTMDDQLGSASVEDVLARYPQRTVLIVLPKWTVMADPQRRGYVQHYPGMGDNGPLETPRRGQGDAPESGFEVPMLAPQSNGALFGPHRLVPVTDASAMLSGTVAGEALRLPTPRRRPRSIAGDRFTPVVGLGDGALLALWDQPQPAAGADNDGAFQSETAGPLPGRSIYVLADPDILNNIGMADPVRATAAVALLDALGAHDEGVTFDVTLNGLGASDQSLLRLAFTPPFLGLTLCLVVAALLALWQGFVRFGPALRETRTVAFGKAALVANSAQLIVQARRLPGFADRYVSMVREAAAQRLHAPSGLAGAALDRWLDRFTDSQGSRFSDLSNALERARTSTDIVAGASALGQWRKDILRDSH